MMLWYHAVVLLLYLLYASNKSIPYFGRNSKMNTIQKSEAIKAGLRKGFQEGSSKMAHQKCYGYEVGSDGGTDGESR